MVVIGKNGTCYLCHRKAVILVYPFSTGTEFAMCDSHGKAYHRGFNQPKPLRRIEDTEAENW